MPFQPWKQNSPSHTRVIEEFPAGELDLRDALVSGASPACTDVVERGDLVNVTLEKCDIAGFVGINGRAARVLVRDSRLRGVTWATGIVEDADFVDLVGGDVSFRFSSLRRVRFRDCTLPRMDFTETTFDRVLLQNCDLRGSKFDHAKVKSLRIEGCDLLASSGVDALAGASIHEDVVQSLAESMAVVLGIVIE